MRVENREPRERGKDRGSICFEAGACFSFSVEGPQQRLAGQGTTTQRRHTLPINAIKHISLHMCKDKHRYERRRRRGRSVGRSVGQRVDIGFHDGPERKNERPGLCNWNHLNAMAVRSVGQLAPNQWHHHFKISRWNR